MIIRENKDILNAIEKYNESGDENELVQEIISLVKPEEEADQNFPEKINTTPPAGMGTILTNYRKA